MSFSAAAAAAASPRGVVAFPLTFRLSRIEGWRWRLAAHPAAPFHPHRRRSPPRRVPALRTAIERGEGAPAQTSVFSDSHDTWLPPIITRPLQP